MAKKSPMERTLERLRELKFEPYIVEKWNPFARVRQDAYGIADVLAYGPVGHVNFGGIWLVQTTTWDNRLAHYKKIQESEHLKPWLANGGRFLLLTWGKEGKFWKERWEEIK